MERHRFRSDELRAARAARFAAQLADCLYALGLTHKDLAAGLGVAPSTVDSWTRGADPKIPSEATFARLCAWLDGQAPGTGRKLAVAAGRVWTPAADPAPPERPPRAATLLATPTPPTNLPLPLTSFVGRERELAEIAQLLGATRLLTLTGAGGIGKTRLALQVAAHVAPSFPDGVWLVELGALTEARLVPQAVATALGVREQPGERLSDTLGAYLHARHALLILDNCEHLVAACAAFCATLLQNSRQLTVLATSQEAFRIAGEIPWPVPPLTAPAAPAVDAPPPASLLECEAVRLFVDRARLNQPGFDLTPANAAAVAQVCARLDGVPLALELAAACLRVLTVSQLAARLDDRFRLLTGGDRLALPRHQTLRATLAWSYDLLAPPERTLFARLAVFAGGWTLEGAEAVCCDVTADSAPGVAIPISTGEVLPLLTELVAKSWVKVEVSGPEARYTLLETIRAYAAERQAASGDGALRERHARYYLALAETAEPQLAGPQQGAWLDRLEVEHDNLRAALRWSQEIPAAGLVSLRLAGALSRFWVLRGYLGEGRAWVSSALAHSGATERSAARAQALFSAGRLAHVQGDLAAARAPLEESAAMWREQGETQQLASAQTLLGLVLGGLGDPAAARAVLEESVTLLRRGGTAWGLARALFCLGDVVAAGEDFAAASSLLEESLVLFRQVGDGAFIANTVMALGELAREQGDLARAAALSSESLDLYRAQGFTAGIALALKDLGDVAWAQDAGSAARDYYAESLRLCRELDDQEGIATALLRLGQLAHAEGDGIQATALLGDSLRLHRDLGHKPGLAQALLHLGWVALDQGEAARAAPCFQESLALAQELGSPRGRADGLLGLAAVALAEGQAMQAAQLLGQVAGAPIPHRPPVPPGPRTRYEPLLATVRAQLDEATFAAAWAAGQQQAAHTAAE